MIELLTFLLTVTALALGVVTLVAAVRGSFRADRSLPAAAVLEVGLLAQATLGVVGLLRGHRPADPGVHVAYLVVSVAVLPVAVSQVAGRQGRWAGVLLACAYLVVAIVVVRLQTTWRVTHG